MLPEFRAPILAIVRDVPASFHRCLRTSDLPIDVDRARAQHHGYVAALIAAGVEVLRLPADEAHPDACFIEDTAVVLGAHALITHPGAPSRRGEVGPVADALARHRTLQPMHAPAILDGGDVLRAGPLLFVGLSSRSDHAGARALAELAAREQLEVRTLDVAAGLHLKSAVTLVDPHTLILHNNTLDPAPFLAAGLDILRVDEPAGGNVLALGPHLLVSADAPATAALLAGRGHALTVLELGEFHRADGALTCLSLRLPAPGTWCA